MESSSSPFLSSFPSTSGPNGGPPDEERSPEGEHPTAGLMLAGKTHPLASTSGLTSVVGEEEECSPSSPADSSAVEDGQEEGGDPAETPAPSTTTPSPTSALLVRDKYGRFKKAARRAGRGGTKIAPSPHGSTRSTEQGKRNENDDDDELEEPVEDGDDEGATDEDRDGTSAPPQHSEDVAAAGDDAATASEQDEPWDPPIIVDGTTVEFALDPVRRLLTCGLCGGCYRDPLTTTKCLHTFCRSCLYVAFSRGHYNCPACDTYLGQDPHKCALPDGALRTLIDKVLFPDVVAHDKRREEAFYARLGIARKPPAALLLGTVSGGVAVGGLDRGSTLRKKRPLEEEEEEDTDEPSPPETLNGGGAGDGGDRPGAAAAAAAAATPAPVAEPVTFRLVPNLEPREGRDTLPPLTHPFLKTDGSIRIGQIKKYIGLKLALLPSSVVGGTTDGSTVIPAEAALEILCQNVPLGNELSVQFARRALWSPSRDAGGVGGADPAGLITFTYRLAKPITSQTTTAAPSPSSP